MQLALQIVTKNDNLPQRDDFERWCEITLAELGRSDDAELTIRLVDNDEIQQLNRDYRGKDKPTNVLSFPFEPYEALLAYAGDAAEFNLLGDMVMAPAVIEGEAKEQGKSLDHHYAHMTVHGILHLLGYDHIEEDDAETMESLEKRILATMGIANPYA
ncbi:MAG: rRNA maturation RNase YbeY [Gammaproteobacteria bacterium]|nr:MAG: rRNA maturation RNase YbeY [Gammaproteobacteria bacterium]